MTRTEAREQAFLLIFEKSFHSEEMTELLETAADARSLEDDPFIRQLAEGTFNNIQAIDAVIEKNCVGWKKERISRVALSAMRLCCYEIFFEEKIPVAVSIDQAVELCKKYATTEDASYVNGVLGSIAREKDSMENGSPAQS